MTLAMPQFGVCTAIENAPAAFAIGWDFVEANVQTLLEGQTDDAQWRGLQRVQGLPIKIPSANSLVPPALKLVGPTIDVDAIHRYMARVLRRANKIGIKTLVFGSGGARNVPDGFDRAIARQQIIAFLQQVAPLAQEQDITIVIEPLNQRECNILNTVAEAMEYVRTVNHPHIQCLVDSYHFWLEQEPLDHLKEAMPHIKHVHVADMNGRTAPGRSGSSDYHDFFRVLKQGGYKGLIAVEANQFKGTEAFVDNVLDYLRKQWREA